MTEPTFRTPAVRGFDRSLKASALEAGFKISQIMLDSVQASTYGLMWTLYVQRSVNTKYRDSSEIITDAMVEDERDLFDTMNFENRSATGVGHEGEVVFFISQNENNVRFQFASDDWDELVAVRDKIKARFPVIVVEDEEVRFAFWNLDTHGGAQKLTRKLKCDTWDDIERNYPKANRNHLSQLMNTVEPGDGGKLILLHGPPGTGKSHFIRALAKQWKPWCAIEYVIDPEEMFSRASYMIATLLDSNNDRHSPYGQKRKTENPWRLLILEDSGEFLRADAKQQIGQGFSRLLNLADGILGQGMNLMLLVTTNEDPGKLHPAVTRPGRCLSNLHFGNFTPAEASEWLGSSVSGEMSIASLYEAKSEQSQINVEAEAAYRPGTYA